MDDQIDARLPGLRESLATAQGDTTVLNDQITQLEILRGDDDPTIEVETLADVPTTQVAPRPLLSIAGGLLAGLILGVAAAFASQILDPRLRREEQLRRLYRLPILARIPEEPPKKDQPLGPPLALPLQHRGLPLAARDARRHRPPPRRQAGAPGHRPLGFGGQDDDRDQPRRLACRRGTER